MTETVKRRGLWLWLVLVAALFLVTGQLAWRFRPLNRTERQLIGVWINPDTQECYTFTSDRRFQFRHVGTGYPPLDGSWRCSADRYFRHLDIEDGWTRSGLRRRLWRLLDPPDGAPVRFESSSVNFGEGRFLPATSDGL